MVYAEYIPLSQHDVISAPECEEIRDQVMALEGRWTERSEGSFFTLGAASYLDASRDRELYLNRAMITNPVLQKSFDWLHDRVRQFFEELLGETVFFDSEYALPGFHIFVLKGGDRSRDDVAARAHFDLQWMHALPGQVPTGTLSFTLPVDEPSGGASMAIWHARYQEAVHLGFSASEYASAHPWQTLSYTPGRIVVHDGFVLHAIGRAAVAAPEGFRITLQGHGVRLPQGWMLYW
jgi:hypothetical protein